MPSFYPLRPFASFRCQQNPVRRAAIETLETRRLLDAVAPNYLVIADGTQNFGNTRRSFNYYDVSNLTGTSTNYFGQTPTFTIWPGYEITTASNFEDLGTFDVNPFNGDTYFLAFDSGPVGVSDPVGDTQGDYDLYRFNFTHAYSDFIVNARPAGIMYTDGIAPDGFSYHAYDNVTPGPTGLPGVVSGTQVGVPPGRDNTDTDPKNDFHWVDGLVDKIGEVRRYGATGGVSPFFDPQDIQFVDPGRIVLMENKPTATDGGTLDNDYSIRTIERISTSPGAATPQANETGGYNGNTTESWESFLWSGNNFVDMDDFAGTNGGSEVEGMRYVERDGVRGVWVSEADGGGDDFQFFELNFTTRVATKTGVFALDEDPVINDNLGDVDFFEIDEAGSLFVSESGNFDTPQTEPNVQSLTITTYTGGVTFGTWTVEPDIAPTADDDALVTDGRFGVLNRGQDRVYYFDADAAGPGVVSDVYVYDLNTNTLIYQELNAANHFTIKNHLRAFSLGDYAITSGNLTSRDGIVKAEDIDALYARIADPTLGGRFTAALGSEMFDLTGEHTLTGGAPGGSGVNGDVDYLVRRSLQTEYGDANLDARVNLIDYNVVSGNFNQSPRTWAQGDFTGNGLVNLADYNALSAHFNFVAAASSVPRFELDDDKDEKEDDAAGLTD